MSASPMLPAPISPILICRCIDLTPNETKTPSASRAEGIRGTTLVPTPLRRHSLPVSVGYRLSSRQAIDNPLGGGFGVLCAPPSIRWVVLAVSRVAPTFPVIAASRCDLELNLTIASLPQKATGYTCNPCVMSDLAEQPLSKNPSVGVLTRFFGSAVCLWLHGVRRPRLSRVLSKDAEQVLH